MLININFFDFDYFSVISCYLFEIFLFLFCSIIILLMAPDEQNQGDFNLPNFVPQTGGNGNNENKWIWIFLVVLGVSATIIGVVKYGFSPNVDP